MRTRSVRQGMRFLILLVLSGIAACAYAQEEPNPEKVIRDFYRWYVGELVGDRDPFEEGREELQRYATQRLLKEIDAMRTGPDGLDADYFLSAQDFDKDWAKNITVSEVTIEGERAMAKVDLTGSEIESQQLMLSLAREDGAWKIDAVEGKQD